MTIHSRRYRSGVLLATGLASGLLLVIPVTGLAQTHPPDAVQGRPAKHALLEREAQEIAAAQAAPKPPKDVAKPPRIQRQSLPSAGQPEPQTALSPLPHQAAGAGTIVESGLAPFPGSLYTFENRWYEATGEGDLVVYAGAERDDPAQGLVATRLIGVTPGPAAVYRTPMRSGAVRIVGAEGKRLSLVSGSGTRLVFDVSSRTFGR
jgi:hypothetical protein